MANVVLYIATSLDGKIARTNDQLDWLFAVEGEGDNGYADFFQTVGAVIMGRRRTRKCSCLSRTVIRTTRFRTTF
ncbi:hypothetical protein [Exiguobacterium mexicanum]|uniref:hypothetical protein n=1 Tax=Exiguobacterium mexicanum TaxID=340146 RepID=UPI0037C02353